MINQTKSLLVFTHVKVSIFGHLATCSIVSVSAHITHTVFVGGKPVRDHVLALTVNKGWYSSMLGGIVIFSLHKVQCNIF